MEQVKEAEEALLKALRESSVCRRFEEAKKQLEGHEEERRVIDAFRCKTYLVSSMSESLDIIKETGELYREREKLVENLRIGEYLESELELCRLLRRICLHLMEVSDLQLEAFEDQIL